MVVATSEPLFESCLLRGEADRAAGVIRNVKVAGHRSRWGREYTPEALRNAVRLYEGKPVNLNHPTRAEVAGTKPRELRKAEDRVGLIKNVRYVEGDGLRGDFFCLNSHPMANRVYEDAERNLGVFGFSHLAFGTPVQRGGKVLVEAIDRVESVDLVVDPATTANLFESFAESAPAASAVRGFEAAGARRLLLEQFNWAVQNGHHELATAYSRQLVEAGGGHPRGPLPARVSPGQLLRQMRTGRR